jgi:hypothetical protein
MWGTVTNVLESVSDIVDDRTFREARSQLRLMLEVSPAHFLPSADEQFRMALGLISEPEDAPWWIQIAEKVASSKSLSDLALNLDSARQLRENHERAFLQSLFERMIPSIKPLANLSSNRFNIRLSGRELQKLAAFLFSPTGRRAVTDAWLARHELDRLVLPARIVEEAHHMLSGYYLAYRGYVLNIFERNLKPRPNDALDLDLAFSLDLPECTLVTGDRRLLEAMERGGMPPARYASIITLDAERYGDAPN